MALTKSMDHVFARLRRLGLLQTARIPYSNRVPLFPNPPDRLYNYAAELGEKAGEDYFETTIGNMPTVAGLPIAETRIAVVGAGAAGTALVRELVKLGFKNITLIEGSNRIGGRLYSIEPENLSANSTTVSEMGAMRMPFFTEGLDQSHRTVRNSLLDHYAQLYGVEHSGFPDPGRPWEITKGTGIFLNEGYGVNPDAENFRSLIQWNYMADDSGTSAALPVPDDPANILNVLLGKWSDFAANIVNSATTAWNAIIADGLDTNAAKFNAAWRERFWNDLTNQYQSLSFYQVTVMPVADGGIGMTQAEANLFYVIGAGDGSWGAFFRISAMYIITTLLFGYGTDHQTIAAPTQKPNSLNGSDSYGNKLPFAFKGLQSFVEMNLALNARYSPHAAVGVVPSFMQQLNRGVSPTATIPSGFNLITQSIVTEYDKGSSGSGDGSVKISWVYANSISNSAVFDHVFITSSPWSTIINSGISGKLIGFEMKRAMSVSHNIMSTKVMLPLKANYFSQQETPPPVYIPQMLATDTYMLQAYAYAQPGDAGILAVSYTWEDDSQKLLSIGDDKHLADMMLNQFGRCLIAGSGQSGIASQSSFKSWCETYIDGYDQDSGLSRYEVIHWELEPLQKGCSKLYVPGAISDNTLMYAYNEQTANGNNPSNIYFSGDMYSFESGWVEGAFRTAMDGLIWFITKNVNPDFAVELQYPGMS